MKPIVLQDDLFQGAVSLEKKESGIRSWRLPYDKLKLFYPELSSKAGEAAGVRIAFESNTTSIELWLHPQAQDIQLDIVIDDVWMETQTLQAGKDSCFFANLSNGMKRIEIYLPQKAEFTAKALLIDDGADLIFLENKRPKWITYGSSITHCLEAESPAHTWPALVARNKHWDLTCLGFAGQCHLEPMVARVIRDLPADIISLCLGINVMGRGSLDIRTFRSAVTGMVSIIREKHPVTPMFLISPIYCSYRETTANATGMTLVIMREEIQEAVHILQSYGDSNLYYIDGLEIFGGMYANLLPDQLHPNAEGYKIMAKHFLDKFANLDLTDGGKQWGK